jgi:hypothetical protein
MSKTTQDLALGVRYLSDKMLRSKANEKAKRILHVFFVNKDTKRCFLKSSTRRLTLGRPCERGRAVHHSSEYLTRAVLGKDLGQSCYRKG